MGTETSVRNSIFTKLVDKHASPLVLRKYTHYGFPIYVSLITDDDLTDLDATVVSFMDGVLEEGWVNNIQTLRNLAGALSSHLNNCYPHTEGVAVVLYVDKCCISSLYGDFMNHAMCRFELYSLLNLSTQV